MSEPTKPAPREVAVTDFVSASPPTSVPPAAVPSAPSRKKRTAEPPQRSILDYLGAGVSTTDEQKRKLQAGSDKRRYGTTGTTPMICTGLECHFIHYCDLNKAGVILPIDDPCPIEQYAVDQWRDNFLAMLDYDQGSAQGLAIRMAVEDLATELMVQSRITQEAAKDPRIEREVTIGMNFKGEPIEITKVNAGLDLLIRLNSSKLKLLRELLATPKAKADVGRLEPNDPGTGTARAHAKANQLQAIRGGGPKYLEVPVFLPKEEPL